jgi:hypothetical protein
MTEVSIASIFQIMKANFLFLRDLFKMAALLALYGTSPHEPQFRVCVHDRRVVCDRVGSRLSHSGAPV